MIIIESIIGCTVPDGAIDSLIVQSSNNPAIACIYSLHTSIFFNLPSSLPISSQIFLMCQLSEIRRSSSPKLDLSSPLRRPEDAVGVLFHELLLMTNIFSCVGSHDIVLCLSRVGGCTSPCTAIAAGARADGVKLAFPFLRIPRAAHHALSPPPPCLGGSPSCSVSAVTMPLLTLSASCLHRVKFCPSPPPWSVIPVLMESCRVST